MIKTKQMDKIFQPKEKFTIDDVETLKVVADTRRMNLLHLLQTPKTVKELADDMEMEASKLYYHINLLEKHNLIQIVATSIVSGIIEKQYQVSAREFTVDRHLLATPDPTDKQIEDMLEIVFDSARNDVRRGIKAGRIPMFGTDEDLTVTIWRSVNGMRPAQYHKFVRRFRDLIEEFTDKTAEEPEEGIQSYGFTFALYPLPLTEKPTIKGVTNEDTKGDSHDK
jgi:DNA-binding transcriptional ArsR family regulator